MLTYKMIKAAKPKAKVYKLFDGNGLHVRVQPTGTKIWCFKYRFGDAEKQLSLGPYPSVTLADARHRCDEARVKIHSSPPVDPGAKAGASSFAAVSEDYLNRQVDRLAHITVYKARWQLREFINPYIGDKPIAQVTAPDLLAALRRIEHSGNIETAHKAKELCGRIFRYAIATGQCERDVAADLKGALTPRPEHHLAAITDPAKVGELLRAIEGYEGQPATIAALRLAPHVFLRPGELRRGRWAEIDFKNAVWRIPSDRMKMRRDHLVPLSLQSISILTGLAEMTGGGEFMFPAIGTQPRPISENSLGGALRRLGYGPDQMVAHGFRSMASTLLHELGYDSRDVELQLAHADSNKIRGIYNRSERIKERIKMMQAWSDYLDSLRDGSNVVAIRRKA
ncbi:MAG: tyrosine-type recombinase/integrase [Steroidobacteraceae bacterium]